MVFLLQHLLRDAAKRYPDKDAVLYNDEKMTYRELDELSDKLATMLRENGVERGDRVGIYINKSIPSIISIHGILKAGAVYVPLDPNAPVSRLAYIIENCGIRCLLTSTRKAQKLKEMFPEENPLEVVILTDAHGAAPQGIPAKMIEWSEVCGCQAQPVNNPSIETDLAYILYTSGSTGIPKGVMISHLNSLTFVNWAHDTFNVNPRDRLSNHAPLHFDLSIFDIFVAFKAAATLVLVPEGASTFPIRLADWIEENRISIWYSVPSILSLMVLHGKLERHAFANLRTVLFAGEVFPVKYLRTLMELIPKAEYYNLYGPTETNVITYYKVPKLSPERTKPIPIGKTCANMEVFALTEDGKRVTSPGEEGELFARGSCVAQGYWGDPEKTNRLFVPNHTQPNFQEKMYRTGDLVTLDEEGNYIYLGRRDHMVKSRGYRIELGEVEAILYSHPEVKEAAVVAVPDELIGNRLKAFVVLNKSNGLTAKDLEGFCAKKVPHYMVPEKIELFDTLPKTSTGKIDRPTLAKQA
ncbi:MAG: D-alanine--poly(phosphoribitol) ligase [Calditrichaeota bacterium]|nr:MAG: D-alanine--poly(phosphoribitol) ligase [Calditrichota bacterium]